MKVIAINGSPRKNGNTHAALEAMRPIFQQENIEFEILWIGNKPIYNCIACNQCHGKIDGTCILSEDILNEYVAKMAQADGLIFGTPVYYAGISGGMKSFMDRAFRTNALQFAYKPVAGICALRRSGGVETFNQLNNYFSLSRSLIVPTSYWSAFHGSALQEVTQDLEAMDCAREIATNMSWLIKTLAASNVPLPNPPTKTYTNFIR